ncbi:MAG: helix-turn-helix domain-containing protein [Thermoguttaceae bacterium]|nr:helix-turn-helix domain-containing protein [Thermoguttaceae bacterium]
MTERVRAAREALGIDAEELADRVRVSPRFLAALERRACVVDVGTALRIARALNETVEALFGDPEPEPVSKPETRAKKSKREASERSAPKAPPKASDPASARPKPSDSKDKRDVVSAEKRSEIMSKVRSTKNKSTELRMIEEFKRLGITGWRRGVKLFGKPDFLFRQLRIAVFVDGCLWHGHNCRNVTPKDHADYWRAKIERNKARDLAVTERLEKLGYLVVRVWECDFKKASAERLSAKMEPILRAFNELKEREEAGEKEEEKKKGKKPGKSRRD